MIPPTLSHFCRRKIVLASALFLITASAHCFINAARAQQNNDIEPKKITLRKDGVAKPLTSVKAKDANGNDVVPSFKEFTKAGVADYDAASNSFKPIKEGTTTAKLQYTPPAQEGQPAQPVALPDLEITVLPKVESYVLTYKGKQYKSTNEIRISRGYKWENVQVTATDAEGKPVDGLTATVKPDATKLEVSSSGPYTLTAKAEGTATVNFKSAEDAGQDFKVKVVPPISFNDSEAPDANILERSTRIYVPKIIDTGGAPVSLDDPAYGVTVEPQANDYVKMKDVQTFEAGTLDTDKPRPIIAFLKFPAAVRPGSGAAPDQMRFTVNVIPTGTYIYFVPPTQPLFPNGSVRIDAYFRDRGGAPVQSYHVTEWTIDKQKYGKYIALAPEGNSVTVLMLDETTEEDTTEQPAQPDALTQSGRVANDAREQVQAAKRAEDAKLVQDAKQGKPVNRPKKPSVIPITATAVGPNGTTVTGTAYVQLRQVTKFQPLSVKLNVMDETTAKDLYGGVAADEYYILMVRLFNDLRDDETKRYTGASIIVYSGSVEVAVNLEKQYDKKSNSSKRKPANPTPSPSPTDSYVNDGRWYEVDPFQDVQIPIGDFNYTSKKPTEEETALNFGDDPVCEDTITYRPLMFEMVVNTVDRREGRSLRSQVFSALELVGIGASFSSAIRFPRPGRDLPIVTDRFTNLLVPGLEKVFPSLKEQHRQNIVAQLMKPIEEVPFGSDITRVLFIPKRAMRGVIPNHKVRISQICPYYFKIKVAVVDKTGQSVVEQGTRR